MQKPLDNPAVNVVAAQRRVAFGEDFGAPLRQRLRSRADDGNV
jgi:hypothetical protein